MKKNRLFSIILCCTVLFSNTLTILAEENIPETSIAQNATQSVLRFTAKQEEATSALRALGFVTEDYTEEIILESGDITRAKFVEFANKVYNFGIQSDSLYYHDVSRTQYASGSISAFVEKGILTIGEDKLFRPDDYIKPAEAAKIIVYALGYGGLCNLSDNPMLEASTLANDLDLFQGVNTADGRISFADMLVMVYNSLTVELPKINHFQSADNETFLSRYYGIYVDKGQLTGFDGTSIFGEALPKDQVKIGNELFEAKNIDLYPYFGKTIKYFYSDDDPKQIIWAKDLGKEKEIIITRENNPQFSASTNSFTYYVGDKQKTVKLSSNVNIIYNGVHLHSDVASVLSGNLCSVKLMSSGSGEYDICMVESYENVSILSNDLEAEALYVKYFDTALRDFKYRSIDLSKEDRCTIVLPDGTIGTQASIPTGAILSIYESADKSSKIRIVCSVARVKGTIERMDNDGGQTFTVGGSRYCPYRKDLIFDYTVGNNVELQLDAEGYIADIELLSGAVRFAYFLGSQRGDRDSELELKLYDISAEEFRTVTCAKRVKVDGEPYKGASDTESALAFTHFGTAPQLIAYQQNDDGLIRMIDTPEVRGNNNILTQDNMLLLTDDFASLQYNSRTHTFGPKIRVGSNTLFLSIPLSPSSRSENDEFSVGSLSYFSNESYYTISTYQYGTEKRKEVSDILLCNSCRFYNEYWVSTRFLVDSVDQVLNDEGEVVYQISGYHGNAYKTLSCTEEVTKKIETGTKPISKGDVIYINNETGHVDDFDVLFGPDATTRPTSSFTMSGARATCFYPVDVVGTTVFGGINSMSEFEEIFTSTGVKIFVYDSKTNQIREGTLGDLHTYEVYGDNCSSVFYYMVSGEVRNFIIYN